MEQGFNKANAWERISSLLSAKKQVPCVFLSHKKEDKGHCRIIGNYLSQVGINYYLDENDDVLQQASNSGNFQLITESLKKGIRESTHMLVIVSENTYKSHWVPFEIGYGHAEILDKGLENGDQRDKVKLSVLTLKDISETKLPDYLLVGNVIRGTKGLNEYITNIGREFQKANNSVLLIESNTKIGHPLDGVLNWKL